MEVVLSVTNIDGSNLIQRQHAYNAGKKRKTWSYRSGDSRIALQSIVQGALVGQAASHVNCVVVLEVSQLARQGRVKHTKLTEV
jgi:hypothetical protein